MVKGFLRSVGTSLLVSVCCLAFNSLVTSPVQAAEPQAELTEGTSRVIIYHLADQVSAAQVDDLIEMGLPEEELEFLGYIEIIHDEVFSNKTTGITGASITLTHGDGKGAYFYVGPKDYVNVLHYPPTGICYQVWHRTTSTSMKANFYWRNKGSSSSWSHFGTWTVTGNASSVPQIYSSPAGKAAEFRYKYNNANTSSKETWVELDVPSGDTDCYLP